MASKDTEDSKPEAEESDVSLDMSQAAVKKMIADARERGYITYEQLNQVMPPEQAPIIETSSLPVTSRATSTAWSSAAT